jgi:hypothetical protein
MSFDDLISSKEAVITRADAASALRCDPRLISRGVRENKIPHITLGRRVMILREPFIALFMGADWSNKNAS